MRFLRDLVELNRLCQRCLKVSVLTDGLPPVVELRVRGGGETNVRILRCSLTVLLLSTFVELLLGAGDKWRDADRVRERDLRVVPRVLALSDFELSESLVTSCAPER